MVQFSISNEFLLSKIYKIPFLKYFFIPRINKLQHFINRDVIQMAYRLIYVKNSVTKQTSDSRFSKLDYWVLQYLPETNNIIHDIAVSNGITSLKFAHLIKENNIDAEYYISDKYSKLKYSGSRIMKIYDHENSFLFGYFFFLVATDKIKYFYLSTLIYKLLNSLNHKQVKQTIVLYDKSVRQAISQGSIFDIEYDIFNNNILTEKFTFIRCMNILNFNYFDRHSISIGLVNIKNTLKEGGLLLVGRTFQDGENQASLFIKQNNRFHLQENYNGGSEIQQHIEAIN